MSRKRKVVEEGEDFLQREASISQVRAEVQQQKAREDKEAKKKARKVEIEGLVNRFLIEGFEVVKEPLVPVPQSCLFPLGKPDRRQITTAVARDEWKIFMKILPKSFFEMIADSTNANMQAKKASGQIDKQTFRKYCKESVTARDILNVFALLQYFRIEVGEASLAQKFKKDPPYGMKAWPMSRERFTAITSSLDADLDALRALLTTTWAKCVNPASVFAMDEGLFAFYSRLHNTPMRYIPRKPHKNGLLAYIAAFKLTSGVPYVFDIALDTEINDPLKGREVLLQFLQRWPWEAVNPHLSKKQISGNGKMPGSAPIPAAIRQGRMAAPFRLPFRCHFVLRRGQGSRHSGQEPEGAPLPPPFTPPRERSSFRIAGELGLIGPPVILSASSPHPTLLKRFEWRGDCGSEDGCLPPRWSS